VIERTKEKEHVHDKDEWHRKLQKAKGHLPGLKMTELFRDASEKWISNTI